MNAKEVKVLIAEHDANDIELMEYELKIAGINYVSKVVTNEHDYSNALKIFKPDLILADYTFPSFDGPSAFKIREALAPDTPFIFVSGTIGEEKSIELIRQGVTDYALKDKLFTLNVKVIRALKESEEKQQKKKAEQELAQSEARLARAQQVAHMGNWEWNFATNNIRWSDEACRIFGVLPDQKNQSFATWLSFIHPADLESVLKKVKDCRGTLLNFSMRYRIVHRNGLVKHVYSDSKVEFDSNAKPSGLYGIVQDVSQTALLEIELTKERLKKQREITAAVLTAQEKERTAIAIELHENLNQILGASKLHIEMAKTDEVNRQTLLKKSSAYIKKVIEEIGKISKALGSPDKQVGLFSSIEVLLADLSRVHPIKIQFHENTIDEEYLDEKLQLTIFRIVQEQVKNILQHSNATRATIELTMRGNEIMLVISDNGKGSVVLKEINGLGIRNIKSRADLHSGTVTIASSRLKGYTLRVALQLNSYMNKQELEETHP